MSRTRRSRSGLAVYAITLAALASSSPSEASDAIGGVLGKGRVDSAVSYSVTDLGVIQRISADVMPGLSPAGHFVITQQMESGAFTGVYGNGSTQRTLTHPPGFLNSFAYSVNDSGRAVGWSNSTRNPVDSASTVHATLFTVDGARDLGTLGGPRSCAYAINSANIIVGVADLPDHRRRAFRFADGKMVALPPLVGGNYSAAFDVNDAGDVVGASEFGSPTAKPSIHAVLWHGSELKDLGTLSHTGNSIAYAINNQGDVVGVSDSALGERVFLYADGKIKDLNIRGHAFAINDRRQIVGTITPAERSRPRGFLWEHGELRDLDNLIPPNTWHIETVYRVNDRGQLLCSGYGNGNLHALLLNPQD